MNDVKIFVPRTDFESTHRDWKTVAAINDEQLSRTKEWMESRRAYKKRMDMDMDNDEDDTIPDTLDTRWWKADNNWPAGYGEEGDWSYWKGKSVNLQRLTEQ